MYSPFEFIQEFRTQSNSFKLYSNNNQNLSFTVVQKEERGEQREGKEQTIKILERNVCVLGYWVETNVIDKHRIKLNWFKLWCSTKRKKKQNILIICDIYFILLANEPVSENIVK